MLKFRNIGKIAGSLSNVKIIINFGQYSIPVFDCSSSAFVIFEIVVKLVVVVANVVIVGAVDSVPI